MLFLKFEKQTLNTPVGSGDDSTAAHAVIVGWCLLPQEYGKAFLRSAGNSLS